jgi:ABC-type multidrug transport system ATPase subunit
MELLMPWFNYGRIFHSINAKTLVNSTSFYTLEQASALHRVTSNGGVAFDAPSDLYSVGMMALSSCLFLLLAWYLGQVFSDAASKPFHFVLLPSYWQGSVPSPPVHGDTLAERRAISARDQSLEIHKLSKTYAGSVQALKEFSFSLKSGQVWALLGQNGAGKSSLISCLSGSQNQTHGEAYAFGLSTRDDIQTLQTQFGKCAQDDLLWPSLTARDHLRLWCAFKGVESGPVMSEHVESKLASVALVADGDKATGTFSGGMKRRLSVALALVGDPRLVFLDEPTTGMDPLSRRRVWKFIQEMKTDKIVILTTHSMEEADTLGDVISIMANGQLKASGSSLFLKNAFGKGYQINLTCKTSFEAEVVKLCGHKLPGSGARPTLPLPSYCPGTTTSTTLI